MEEKGWQEISETKSSKKKHKLAPGPILVIGKLSKETNNEMKTNGQEEDGA